MAKIQIEYTANVEALKSKLNELVRINETLSRSVFATKMALEDMSKATSQSTTKKALDDIKKASDSVAKSANATSASLQKSVSDKQKEVEAKKKADLYYVKWWESELNKLEKAEERKAAQVVRIAQREAKQREAAMKAATREAERAERQRQAAMAATTRRAEAEERRRVVAAERAEREKVRATEKAEAQRVKQTEKATQSMMAPLMALRGYVAAAFAVSSIVNLGEEVIKLLAKLELLQSRLNFIYGGTEAGSAAFLRVSAAIKNLGLEYEETLEQATAFSIAAQQAGYTTTETEKMFISFASSLRAAGSSSLQVQRSFYALQQMMSKGVVSAEELNRQMGESLPGAAMLMFKAFKNLHPELVQSFEDFRKLQKEGKILSAEVLPEFIRVVEDEFGPALDGKKNSLSARLNRLSQAYAEFKASLLDTEPIKQATDNISGFLSYLSMVLSSEKLSKLEKFQVIFGGNLRAFNVARREQAGEMATAVSQKYYVEREIGKFNELDKKQQQEAYDTLDKQLKLIKAYTQAAEAAAEAQRQFNESQTQENADKQLLAFSRQTAAFNKLPTSLFGGLNAQEAFGLTSTAGRQKSVTALVEEVRRNMSIILGAPGKGGGLDEGGTKGEDPRVKAIEDQIAAIRALMIQEQDRMNNYNQDASFQISTSELLLKLTSALAEKTKELDLLKAEGKGEEALARAEAEKTVLEAQIKLTNQLIALEIHKLEVEKSTIEERLANTTSGSIEEYRIREELMNKTAEIEKKKVENNAEAVKKITAQTNAEIKKMYDDLEKRIKQFLSETEEMIAAPFRTEREQEIADINKKFDQQIQSVTEQYQLGTLFSGQKKEGQTPEEGLAYVLKYVDLITRLNKARQKTLSESEGDGNILGLSDEDLEKLKKALNVALDLFQDYYAARTEIAKNAIEAEQSLLEKKFEAGLIRENEYNEETKKNKEEMAKLDRDAARFGVLINTAQAIVKLYTDFDAITATILAAGVLAVGATQLSAINSAPMPEFHEGGLDIKRNDRKKPDRGLKQGEFYAKLLEGESVMTREETAKYKDVLKAIREDSFPLQIMKGYTAPAYNRSMDEPYQYAKEQSTLELAFQNAELVDAIRRNGAVAIKNTDELAEAIASKSSYTKITNRRRIR